MRIFAIHDKDIESNKAIGYLFFYERSNEFVIELADFLDEWTAPILFSSLVKNNILTVPKDISKLWVEERVIPTGRQNIGLILKNAKLTTYNEGKLLALSNGISSQDSCYIDEISENDLPDWVKERQASNILESFPIVDNRIICLLKNDTAMEIDLKRCIDDVPKIKTILSNNRIISTLKVDAGGYGITFNNSISISKTVLLNQGVILPIFASVFKDFANHCIVNTSTACDILGCTRQNLNYLVKSNTLHPIKDTWKENVFLRGNLTSFD